MAATEVDYFGVARVELPDHRTARADVELIGGRDRWSVGGRIAEGLRWWRGELSAQDERVLAPAGTQITLALDNGRTAAAVVEASPEEDCVQIRGLGPPPFDVP